MPNEKKLTINPDRWLALNEALEHIRLVQNCTPIEAQRQLKVYIADRTIPVKWADSEGANDIPNPTYLLGTKLKVNLEGSAFVVSDSKPGSAYDEFLETYRPLLVLREAVLKAWLDGTRIVKHNLQKEPEGQKPVAARTENENKQMEWMTLVEAEEHIEVLKSCDSAEALRQLKEEISDGIVSVKWRNDSIDNPDVTILKTLKFILRGAGIVRYDNEYRTLLINRADVLRLWPEPNDLVMQMLVEESDSKTRRGRPSQRDQIWAALSEMKIQELLPPSGNQKKIAEDVAKKCNHKIGSRGWSERTVLQHISDWQKENPPADQKMRK
jgi:hypothetical protein